jgi:uncharacterized membrane protein YcaP (DUF421 family)
MDWIFDADWKLMFVPGTPLTELIVRGSVMYLALFSLLRLILRREVAAVTVPDLLMVVLIADAAQNGIAGDYESISDGLVVVTTIIFSNYLLDRLAFHFPLIARFVHPPPLPLVKDGRLLRRNMRKEFITEEELMTQLREQGIEDIAEVKRACMEGDGRISVITWDSNRERGGARAGHQQAGRGLMR